MLQNGLTAPEYNVKELPEKTEIEQSALAAPQEIHQTFSMLLELLTAVTGCSDGLYLADDRRVEAGYFPADRTLVALNNADAVVETSVRTGLGEIPLKLEPLEMRFVKL